MPTTKPRVSTVLSDTDYEKLREICEHQQVSMSWITKLALRRIISELEQGETTKQKSELNALIALGR